MTLMLVTHPRFEHDPVPHADVLPGDARPGDVLTLPGGTLIRDVNENGRVDGADGRLRGRYVDVRV